MFWRTFRRNGVRFDVMAYFSTEWRTFFLSQHTCFMSLHNCDVMAYFLMYWHTFGYFGVLFDVWRTF